MAENSNQTTSSRSLTTSTQSPDKVQREARNALLPSNPFTAAGSSTTPAVSPSLSPRLQEPVPFEQESDIESTPTEMSSYTPQYAHDSGSTKPSSKSKSKSKTKNDDWTDVAEPEERRRIQNRIAQRKFREKQKEHKERSERDERNQQHAGSIYRVPDAGDLGPEDDQLSGLPWGGVSITHVVSRGHESEARRGSGRDTYAQDDAQYYNSHSGYHTSSSQQQQTASWGSRGSSGGDDQQYYGDYDQEYDYSHDHGNNSGQGSSSYRP